MLDFDFPDQKTLTVWSNQSLLHTFFMTFILIDIF